jgi:hypothetical protein
LAGCDHPVSALSSKLFTRQLDTKGFWRQEKDVNPELRTAVLTQVAFEEIQSMGVDRFLAQNNGEGWKLPETLRLADYGLGHDSRAKVPQPVASALGPRFYPWQMEHSVAESWEECERHAEILAKLLPPPDAEENTKSENGDAVAVDLFKDPLETDLFGDPLYARPRKR